MVDDFTPALETAEEAETAETVDLRKINAALEADVLRLVTQKETQAAAQEHHRLDSYALGRAKALIENFLSQHNEVIFRKTPEAIEADYSIIVPSLTKPDPEALAAAPDKKAKKTLGSAAMANYRTQVLPALLTDLSAQFPWATFEISGIYLNMTLEQTPFLDATLQQVHKLGEEYGNNESQSKERTLLDFSSPNIAKTMHVGHLRSTIIGQVLINILEANGSITYGVNHLGDWGTNFGHIIHAQELWGEEVAEEFNPETQPMEYLAALYSRMRTAIGDKETDEQKAMDQESRTRFTRLEQLDPAMLKYWQEFRRLSFIEFDRMYERLDISFDAMLGESFYNDQMATPVAEIAEQGISEIADDGRTIIRIEGKGDEKIHVLLKSDGSTMYLTRDIAALRHRVKSWKATKMLYVIGSEQESDMNALYHVSAELGDTEPGQAEHLAFGMITKDGKKISSREGAGSLEGLINQLKAAALEKFEKRGHSDPETIDKDAEIIATGALIYGNFAASMSKNMEFDLDKMLSLEGQSGPYLQYSAVRLMKMLEKMSEIQTPTTPSTEFLAQLDPKTTKLVKMMAEFPEQLAQVGKLHAPHLLASFLYEFSSTFNSIYSGGTKFTQLDPATQAEYKYLFEAAQIVLKKGLDLLHIRIPNQM